MSATEVPVLNADGHACDDPTPVRSSTTPHNGPTTSRHESGAVCTGRYPEVPARLSDLHKRVRLAPAVVSITPDGDVTVRVEWQPLNGLERLDAHAWGTGNGKRGVALAKRLAAAIDAGVIVTPGEVYKDVTGRVGVHANSSILARTMNADLRRLGY